MSLEPIFAKCAPPPSWVKQPEFGNDVATCAVWTLEEWRRQVAGDPQPDAGQPPDFAQYVYERYADAAGFYDNVTLGIPRGSNCDLSAPAYWNAVGNADSVVQNRQIWVGMTCTQ